MKQIFVKRLLIAGMAFLTVPSVVLAQKEKEKDKKKEMQTIVITRDGNVEGKTVIEIDGDKVKVDGKDAKDNKDVHVNVNTIKGLNSNVYRLRGYTPGGGAWNLNTDNDAISLFNEDSNRAMLGVTTEGNDKGAEVQSVTKESAAEKAGLKKGDVLTKIGDKKIETTDDVTTAIHDRKPGDKVTITYLRDGKEQKATAELGKWKGIRVAVAPRVWSQGVTPPNIDMAPFENFGGVYMSGGRPKLGLSIQDTDEGKGVKVLDVDDESNAAKAGLKEDDIILSIDDKEIKSTDDVTRLLRENRDKYTYNFKIQRNGKTQNIEVKMPRKLKTADL